MNIDERIEELKAKRVALSKDLGRVTPEIRQMLREELRMWSDKIAMLESAKECTPQKAYLRFLEIADNADPDYKISMEDIGLLHILLKHYQECILTAQKIYDGFDEPIKW